MGLKDVLVFLGSVHVVCTCYCHSSFHDLLRPTFSASVMAQVRRKPAAAAPPASVSPTSSSVARKPAAATPPLAARMATPSSARSRRARIALQVKESNRRAVARRSAATTFNTLGATFGVDLPPLKRRAVTSASLGTLLRTLNKRCTAEPHRSTFAGAVSKWVENGGRLPEGMRRIDPAAPSADVLSVDASAGVPNDNVAAAVPNHKVLQSHFVLKSKAFMLTHNSRVFVRDTWPAYRDWAHQLWLRYAATAWAACFEQSKNAAGDGAHPVYHGHVYLYWNENGQGVHMENLDALRFNDVMPRVDRCVAGANHKSPRACAFHGLWYVTVKKDGTIDSASNFVPWRDYRPLVPWLIGLWNDAKLGDVEFLAMSVQFRTGHANRKRDATSVMLDKRHAAVRRRVADELAELKASGAKKDFKEFALVQRFLNFFKGPFWRRPVLVIIGGTNLGKSMLAGHVLTKVGDIVGVKDFLEITVEDDEHFDLSMFDVDAHAGVILDGVGDALALKRNRETLQGRPKECRGGKSNTMMYAYPYTFSRRAIVVTLDLSAKNLAKFVTDHWLSDEKNCLVLRLTEPAWVDSSSATTVRPTLSPKQLLEEMSVGDLSRFLEERDLSGPATRLMNEGVAGSDFVDLSEDQFVKDLRLTPFAARKLVAARDKFLTP